MLERVNATGVFVGAPTPFTSEGRPDLPKFRANLRRYIDAGVHGIWILGSSGQVQTINDHEFEELVSAFIDEVNGAVTTVVGCTAPSTEASVTRVGLASNYGVDAVLNALPYFVPLRKQEAYRYFLDVADACPDIGLFHYNTARSGTLLEPDDYVRLAEIPSFLGSKQVSTDGWLWMELARQTPELAHWGVDGSLMLSTMFGHRGVWSAIGMWAPAFITRAYQACVQCNWDEARDFQWLINAFLAEVARPLVARGYLDPVVDKTLSDICGFTDPGELRRPFLPVEPEDREWARQLIHSNHRFLLETAVATD